MITRLYIENFGGLHNKEIILNKGLNIIFGKNEKGKTTICAFIRAMLYGVDTERKRDIRGNMRKRYIPFGKAVMSGVLETEEIVIKRSFGTTSKYDTCNAVNRFTGEIIQPEDIGYAVMGMNEACFCNTFYMNNFDSYPTSESEMIERLSDMGVNGVDGASYDKVKNILDNMAKPYTKKAGIVDIAREEFYIAQEYCEEEKKKKEHITLLKSKYDMLLNKKAEAELTLEKMQAEKEKRNVQSTELRNQQRRLIEETATDISGVPNINLPPLVMAIIFAVIGFMFVFSYKNPILMICVSSFVPMVVCLKVSGVFAKKENKSVEIRLAAIENIMAKADMAENSDINAKIKKVNDFLIECAERIGKVQSEISLITVDEYADKKLQEAKEKYEKATEEKDCINVAKYILMQTYEEMKCDFMPEVNKLFSAYFNRLTSGHYSSAVSDKDMVVSVINEQGAVKSDYLSGGTLDAAYFALRLALCDKTDFDKTATLIIDDAFLQYDDERVKNTVQLLFETSRQTIYFTCRENFGNMQCNLIKI